MLIASGKDVRIFEIYPFSSLTWTQAWILSLQTTESRMRSTSGRRGSSRKIKKTKKLFKKIFRGFNALCKNQDEENRQWALYITEESLIKYLPKLFGYKSEFLAKRLYAMLT